MIFHLQELIFRPVGIAWRIFSFPFELSPTPQGETATLGEEFETYRKRTLGREEKMARKHFDELNKYKT